MPIGYLLTRGLGNFGGGGTVINNYITIPPAVAVASQTPGRISCLRGDTLRKALTTLGSVSTRTKAWFTAKRNVNDPDSASLLQIIEGTGLVIYNGQPAADASLASLVINNTTGIPVLTIDEALTSQFGAWHACWDVQILMNGDTSSPISGTIDVSADVTRAIS